MKRGAAAMACCRCALTRRPRTNVPCVARGPWRGRVQLFSTTASHSPPPSSSVAAATTRRPLMNSIKNGSHSARSPLVATKAESKHHSTTSTMDFTHSCPSILLETKPPPMKPSTAALRTLFVASAVPMVGFGAMDNFVMIQAGQYIDSTLGVQLGLATMTAAAAGQVVSDVSGVVFGGALERLMTRMKLIRTPPLSTQQRQLPIARNVAMVGAVIGVIIGCALGATTLLFVDLEARDRIQRAVHLRDVVNDMIADAIRTSGSNGGAHTGGFRASNACKSCTVYIADASHDITLTELSSSSDDDKVSIAQLKLMKDAETDVARQCAENRRPTLSADRRVLYAPVVKRTTDKGAGEVMAVVEFQSSLIEGFCDEDIVTAQVMARHLAIFMDRLAD